jgi:enterochelin esterase family protein
MHWVLLLGMLAQAQQADELVRAARAGDAAAIKAAMEARGAKFAERGAVVNEGQDFVFVAATEKACSLKLNDGDVEPMTRVEGTRFCYTYRKLRSGTTHGYEFFAGGEPLEQRRDVPAYNPDSLAKPGVPKGKLSEKFTITSQVYGGMKAEWWVYASPGVDPATPAPLMVWQDGQGLAVGEGGQQRLFTVTENLVAQKLIPPMVHVLIAPGFSPEGRAMRAVEYDTVSGRYGEFVMGEVLPLVEKMYKLRQDGYSRGIGGSSSGGICSFNMAWHYPEKFARVHSTIGSYTSIAWRAEQKQDGGNLYPFMIRKMPKRNIRVWLSDGANDLENDHGSWPLQNIQMANSLKRMGYDFHFRFDEAAHNGARFAVDLPESLAWLWRGYDAAKTSEVFEQEAAERAKPLYRVRIANREAW